MRGRLTLTILALVFAGCVTPPEPIVAEAVETVLPDVLRLPDDRAVEIDVPVRVILVGFAAGTAAALQAEMTPARIDHDFLDATNGITNPESNLEGGVFTNPILPVARYEIEEAPANVSAAILAFAAASQVPDAEGALYDGRAVEDHLAQLFSPDPTTPILVILHGGDVLEAEHGWRYTYQTGWLDNVRIFGGLTPVLVYDASAQPDPFVTRKPGTVPSTNPFALLRGPREPAAYESPLENGGDATVAALAQAVTDAAHYRLLQGPIYPITTKTCHTVLVYVGVRATALAHRVGAADPASLVDAAAIQGAFANLTGENVTVNVKVVQLPHEDPALDVATRNDLNFDLFRTWADMNWGMFFEDDGCEQYLNTLVITDASESVHGIALMDVERNRRVSFSWLDDATRLLDEDGSPVGALGIFGGRPENRAASRWATFVPTHEAGHLFGQAHPQSAIRDADVDGERAASPPTMAFSSTWDSMSYQAMDRVVDYGAIAQTNWDRNRVGFVLEAARHADLAGTPEFLEALDLLKQYRWAEANALLLPLIQGEHDAECAGRC